MENRRMLWVRECDDGRKDVLIQFKGNSIVYDGLEVEGITYSCEFLAIKDKQEVCPFYNFPRIMIGIL